MRSISLSFAEPVPPGRGQLRSTASSITRRAGQPEAFRLSARLLVYAGAALLLTLALASVADQGRVLAGLWFVATDATGIALALSTGAVCLVYFRSFGARSLVFVSCAFLGTGVLHGLHLLLQLDLGNIALAAETHRTAAASATLGEAYLAALLLMGWRASEGRISEVPTRAVATSGIVTGSVLAAALLAAVAVTLPHGHAWAVSDAVLRVAAGAIGLALSLCLLVFLLRGDWRDYAFQNGFVLFLICASISQFAKAAGPADAGDAYRIGIEIVRVSGYAIAFATVLASTSGLLGQVSDKRLNERIEALIESHGPSAPEWGAPFASAPIRHRLQGAGTFELDLSSGRFRGSPVTARLFGSSEGIDSLERFASLVDASDIKRLGAALELSKHEGVLFKQEFRIRAPEGTRWLEAIAGVETVDNKPSRLLGMVDDITLRKALEAERERLQSDLRQMIAAVDQLAATATLGEDGTIQSANARLAAFCGVAPDSVIGRRLDSLLTFTPDLVPPIDGSQYFAPELPWFGEAFPSQADASGRIAQASLTPHHVDGGARHKLVFVGFDVTERVQAEKALQASIAAHRKSNEDLQMFAHIVSHDLQEPLRMVSSFMTLLERRFATDLAPEAREFIQFAVEGAQRMRSLLEGLLEYSRVNSRGGAFETVDLRRMVDGAMGNLAVLIAETGAEIEIGELPEVRADPSQAVQLFQNLLANAIKFCPNRTPQVRIAGRRNGATAVVTVSDNGIGIDPSHYARIFQIFQRLHPRGEFPGTGVGLAVCKRIMERHDGAIDLESRVGEGTTFRLEFPTA